MRSGPAFLVSAAVRSVEPPSFTESTSYTGTGSALPLRETGASAR